MPAKPIPEGYHTISPSLTIDGAAEAIEFYKRAFGATERSRMPTPDGKVAHAEIEIVDSVVQDAIDAGATVTMPVEDQFWGDRFGTVADPFGHHWGIATHKEDLTPDEIAERGRQAMASMG